jgi:hypothetical protein
MSTGWKIFLIIAGLIVCIVATITVGGYLWWQANGRAMIAEFGTTMQEAARFGANKAPTVCVDEAAKRIKGGGLADAVKVRVFLKSCLPATKPMAGFCNDVPAESEFLKTVSWTTEVNQKYGLTSPAETSVLGELQTYCGSLAKK